MTVVRWREEGWWGTQVGEERNGGMVEGSVGLWVDGRADSWVDGE